MTLFLLRGHYEKSTQQDSCSQLLAVGAFIVEQLSSSLIRDCQKSRKPDSRIVLQLHLPALNMENITNTL